MSLYDLNPGTTYMIRVVAKNGEGLEAPSPWQEFSTAGVGECQSQDSLLDCSRKEAENSASCSSGAL